MVLKWLPVLCEPAQTHEIRLFALLQLQQVQLREGS